VRSFAAERGVEQETRARSRGIYSAVPLPLPSQALPKLVTKDFQRTTLRPRHRPVLRALAEAMFSPDGEVSGERLDAFVEEVDGFISPASKTLRFGLVLMLVVIRWSPLLFFRFRLFEDLSVNDRVHHLERLEKSTVKQLPLLVIAYKTVLTLIFYEDEAEQRTLGYPGHERKRWKRSLPLALSSSPSSPSSSSSSSSSSHEEASPSR
jgi:hypothetical protein